jgi:hypothetical protein
VLGLVALAVVSGAVMVADMGATLSNGAIPLILGKAIAFLAGSL